MQSSRYNFNLIVYPGHSNKARLIFSALSEFSAVNAYSKHKDLFDKIRVNGCRSAGKRLLLVISNRPNQFSCKCLSRNNYCNLRGSSPPPFFLKVKSFWIPSWAKRAGEFLVPKLGRSMLSNSPLSRRVPTFLHETISYCAYCVTQ